MKTVIIILMFPCILYAQSLPSIISGRITSPDYIEVQTVLSDGTVFSHNEGIGLSEYSMNQPDECHYFVLRINGIESQREWVCPDITKVQVTKNVITEPNMSNVIHGLQILAGMR